MTRKEQAAHLERCEGIVQCILDICNASLSGRNQVTFLRDFGGNSITVIFPGDHTHVGLGDTEWTEFVQRLHEVLMKKGTSGSKSK